MFSLQNMINKLKNITKNNYFYEKTILNYLLSFKPLFKLGVIYPIAKIRYNSPNIFVLLYRFFGRFGKYSAKQTLFVLYRYKYMLVAGHTLYKTYGDFMLTNYYREFCNRTNINRPLLLKGFYNLLFIDYVKAYGTNGKLSTSQWIKWYLKMLRFAVASFNLTLWLIAIDSRFISLGIKRSINRILRDFKNFKRYLILKHQCLSYGLSIIYIKHFRGIEDFLLKYHIISVNSKIIWIPDNSILYLALLKVYNAIRSVVLPVLVSLLMIFLLINFFKIEIYTNVGIWGVLGFFFLWLMSGFNFFVKRYKNGKFTGAIQRFWKRTNAYFWLVEGFLFTLFFYYYLNSSQEPLYMYDESNFNQTFLPNLTTFYFSIILLIFVIFYSYYLLLNISNFSFKQQLTHLLINSVLMIYIFLLESYQFYYLVNTFFEITWEYAEDIKTWVLETENPKIRVKTQYLMLALIAKYWHFVFIFFSWLFLLYKSYERRRVYYSLFGFVIQNCIILMLLNLLFCVQWLKWLIRRYYDVIYYWFFTDSNNWFLNDFTEAFVGLLGF